GGETGEGVRGAPPPRGGGGGAGGGGGGATEKTLSPGGAPREISRPPRPPPATVRVVGGTPIALALADLGAQLGYAVERDDPERSAPLAGDAAVIVASHGREEERVLAEALRAEIPYVGLVASDRRGEAGRAALDVP